MTRYGAVAGTIVACVLSVACGGLVDSAPGTGGATGGSGAGGTGGVSGAGGLDFHVEDESDQPISGAQVVVERPDGTREQATADAKGIAAFNDVDFAAGPLDVTAYSPGRILVSVLGVGATDSRVIRLEQRQPITYPRALDVSVVNPLDPNDTVTVSLTAPYRPADGPPGAEHVAIPDGATGKVLALEEAGAPPGPVKLVAAAAVDIPASGDAVTVDLSKSAVIEHASGTIELPAPGSGAFDFKDPGVAVAMLGPDYAYFVAGVTTVSAASGAAANWQVDFFRPVPESEVVTRYLIQTSNVFSAVFHAGYPTSSPPPLPAAPVLETSGSPADLFAPMHWSAGKERPGRFTVAAVWDTGGIPVWIVRFPAARDTLTLKPPPDKIWNQLDWTDGAHQLIGNLEYCDPDPGCAQGSCVIACSRVSGSGGLFTLSP